MTWREQVICDLLEFALWNLATMELGDVFSGFFGKSAGIENKLYKKAPSFNSMERYADWSGNIGGKFGQMSEAANSLSKTPAKAGEYAKAFGAINPQLKEIVARQINSGKLTENRVSNYLVSQGMPKGAAEEFVNQLRSPAPKLDTLAKGGIKYGAPAPGRQGQIKAGERTTYQDFVDRSAVGDKLEGHELWQHANLKANGLATERLSTAASQNNPVIALDRATHVKVNAAQRALDAANMTPLENIKANADILRRLNAAPESVIKEAEEAAIQHAKSLGYTK